MVGDIRVYVFIDADFKQSWESWMHLMTHELGQKTWDGRFGGLVEDGRSWVESEVLEGAGADG